jgi:hypothetical protein
MTGRGFDERFASGVNSCIIIPVTTVCAGAFCFKKPVRKPYNLTSKTQSPRNLSVPPYRCDRRTGRLGYEGFVLMSQKKCSRCKRLKPLAQFSPHHKRPSELHSWCDSCRAKPMGKTARYYYSCHYCSRAGGSSYGAERKTVWVCDDCKSEKTKMIRDNRRGDAAIKKQLIQERGQRCERCGNRGKVIMHHIKEVGEGGTSKPSNLLLVCQKCHEELHPNGYGKRIYR